MKFTVPVSGVYNTRVSQSNAASGASGVVGIGIVGVMIVGAAPSAVDKDERFINCFYTKEGSRQYIVKRPGVAALNTPASGNVGSAILVWTGGVGGTAVIAAFGATNSTVYSGTSSLGAITGKARSITELFVGTTATFIVSSGDSTAWYYDTGVAVMTNITDGQFPGNAGFTTAGDFVVLDGFTCIMTTDGKIWASDVNSVTAWTANNYDTASSYPDQGVGLVRFKNIIMAFGKESCEFWQNAGLNPFPLQRSKGQTMKIGAISSDAIASLADNVFWCGSTDKGGLSIFQYDGSLSRISPPEIDFQLVLAGPSNISLTTLRFYGRSFVLVKANTTTYVYVLEDKRWHEWSSTTPLWYKCAGLSSGSQILTYSISNISTTGKVFVINPASLVFTDDSVAYTASFQSMTMDKDGQTMFFDFLRIIADTEPSTSTLTISASDDDFVTFDVLGTVDLADAEKRIDRLGASRDRAWKISHSADTAMRIEKMVGEMSVGT